VFITIFHCSLRIFKTALTWGHFWERGIKIASAAYREILIMGIVLHFCGVITYVDKINVTEDSIGTVTSAGGTRN